MTQRLVLRAVPGSASLSARRVRTSEFSAENARNSPDGCQLGPPRCLEGSGSPQPRHSCSRPLGRDTQRSKYQSRGSRRAYRIRFPSADRSTSAVHSSRSVMPTSAKTRGNRAFCPDGWLAAATAQAVTPRRTIKRARRFMRPIPCHRSGGGSYLESRRESVTTGDLPEGSSGIFSTLPGKHLKTLEFFVSAPGIHLAFW